MYLLSALRDSFCFLFVFCFSPWLGNTSLFLCMLCDFFFFFFWLKNGHLNHWKFWKSNSPLSLGFAVLFLVMMGSFCAKVQPKVYTEELLRSFLILHLFLGVSSLWSEYRSAISGGQSPFECSRARLHELCVHICCELCVLSHSVLSDSLRARGLQPAQLLWQLDFPGKNNGVDCHFLLQEIFPTQRSNPRLLSLLYPWATWAVNWGRGMGSCCWAELKWMQINQNLPFKCSPESCKSLIDSRTYSSYIRQILPGRICSRSGDGFLVPLTSSSQNLPFKLF